MSFQDFLLRWNGKYIDTDNAYGAQCMDLMHSYCIEVLGLADPRILAAPSAKDVYNNFENLTGHDHFERIANTPMGIPKEGDIMLWGFGQYGHVAIFIEGNTNRFKSFDQNSPIGSPCHVQEHNYNGCLGWLHFKGQSSQNDIVLQQSNAFIAICSKLNLPANKDVIITEITKLLTYEDLIRQKEQQVNEANGEINNLKSELQKLSDQFVGLKNDNEILRVKVEEQEKTIEESTHSISELRSALQELQEATQSGLLTGWQLIIQGIKKLFKERG